MVWPSEWGLGSSECLGAKGGGLHEGWLHVRELGPCHFVLIEGSRYSTRPNSQLAELTLRRDMCVCEQRGWGGLKGLAEPPCSGTIQSASLLVHHKSTPVGKQMRISLLSLAFYHFVSQIYHKALPQVSVSVYECVNAMAELWSSSLSSSSLSLCPASLRTDAGSVASARRGRGLIGVVVGVNFN